MMDYSTTRYAPQPRDDSLEEAVKSLFWLGHFRKQGYADSIGALAALYDEIKKGNKEILWTDGVESYQKFNWDFRGKPLRPDGAYGHYTKASFGCRCCMHRDIGPLPFGSGQPRWEGSPIMMYWQGNTLGLIDQDFYFRAAAEWSRVCGVTLGQASSRSTADIWAQALRIDGASNTLAWSFSPDRSQRTRAKGGARQLEQRYDTGDIAFYQRQGDAGVIITHEVGHALLFDGHTDSQQDIMYPMHRGPMDFGANEIRIAQITYGKPTGTPPPPPPGGDDVTFYIARSVAGKVELADQPITFGGLKNAA